MENTRAHSVPLSLISKKKTPKQHQKQQLPSGGSTAPGCAKPVAVRSAPDGAPAPPRRSALRTTCTVIQGPPGTGKTHAPRRHQRDRVRFLIKDVSFGCYKCSTLSYTYYTYIHLSIDIYLYTYIFIILFIHIHRYIW